MATFVAVPELQIAPEAPGSNSRKANPRRKDRATAKSHQMTASEFPLSLSSESSKDTYATSTIERAWSAPWVIQRAGRSLIMRPESSVHDPLGNARGSSKTLDVMLSIVTGRASQLWLCSRTPIRHSDDPLNEKPSDPRRKKSIARSREANSSPPSAALSRAVTESPSEPSRFWTPRRTTDPASCTSNRAIRCTPGNIRSPAKAVIRELVSRLGMNTPT
jgi:hypothetical protein